MLSNSRKIRFPQQEYFLKIGFRLTLIMVSTSWKKALKSVSLGRNKVTFLKMGFFLISVMVFINRNKSCKILFSQDQLCYWKPLWKTIFKERLHCPQQKRVFQLVKNSFVHLPDIPGCEPKLFVKWKCIFNEFFNPASGIDFCLLETVFLSLEI